MRSSAQSPSRSATGTASAPELVGARQGESSSSESKPVGMVASSSEWVRPLGRSISDLSVSATGCERVIAPRSPSLPPAPSRNEPSVDLYSGVGELIRFFST